MTHYKAYILVTQESYVNNDAQLGCTGEIANQWTEELSEKDLPRLMAKLDALYGDLELSEENTYETCYVITNDENESFLEHISIHLYEVKSEQITVE